MLWREGEEVEKYDGKVKKRQKGGAAEKKGIFHFSKRLISKFVMARPLNWTLEILCSLCAQQHTQHPVQRSRYASCSMANDYLIEKLLRKYLFWTSNVLEVGLRVISWLHGTAPICSECGVSSLNSWSTQIFLESLENNCADEKAREREKIFQPKKFPNNKLPRQQHRARWSKIETEVQICIYPLANNNDKQRARGTAREKKVRFAFSTIKPIRFLPNFCISAPQTPVESRRMLADLTFFSCWMLFCRFRASWLIAWMGRASNTNRHTCNSMQANIEMLFQKLSFHRFQHFLSPRTLAFLHAFQISHSDFAILNHSLLSFFHRKNLISSSLGRLLCRSSLVRLRAMGKAVRGGRASRRNSMRNLPQFWFSHASSVMRWCGERGSEWKLSPCSVDSLDFGWWWKRVEFMHRQAAHTHPHCYREEMLMMNSLLLCCVKVNNNETN